MQFKPKTKRKVSINITSLIDVVFLLLIFFMVTSTFLEQPGLKLDLPTAKSDEREMKKKKEELTVYLTTDDGLYLNDSRIEKDSLMTKLQQELIASEDSSLVLKADKDVSHGEVIEVMDIAKRSGVKILVVATKIKEEEK